MQQFYGNFYKNNRRGYCHFYGAVGAVVLGLLLFPVCLFGQITVNPARNALVPTTAPIQPPQAFVDNIGKLILNEAASNNSANLSNQSISSIDGHLINSFNLACAGLSNPAVINLSGNALSQASVDDILSQISKTTTVTLNLSGGTNATPTNNISNDDAWDLFIYGQGVIVSFSVHGLPVSMSANVANFSGNALTVSEVNAVLAFLVAQYPTLNQTINLSGGTNAAPTGQGITDKNTLIANGWTVTTN